MNGKVRYHGMDGWVAWQEMPGHDLTCHVCPSLLLFDRHTYSTYSTYLLTVLTYRQYTSTHLQYTPTEHTYTSTHRHTYTPTDRPIYSILPIPHKRCRACDHRRSPVHILSPSRPGFVSSRTSRTRNAGRPGSPPHTTHHTPHATLQPAHLLSLTRPKKVCVEIKKRSERRSRTEG